MDASERARRIANTGILFGFFLGCEQQGDTFSIRCGAVVVAMVEPWLVSCRTKATICIVYCK